MPGDAQIDEKLLPPLPPRFWRNLAMVWLVGLVVMIPDAVQFVVDARQALDIQHVMARAAVESSAATILGFGILRFGGRLRYAVIATALLGALCFLTYNGEGEASLNITGPWWNDVEIIQESVAKG